MHTKLGACFQIFGKLKLSSMAYFVSFAFLLALACSNYQRNVLFIFSSKFKNIYEKILDKFGTLHAMPYVHVLDKSFVINVPKFN